MAKYRTNNANSEPRLACPINAVSRFAAAKATHRDLSIAAGSPIAVWTEREWRLGKEPHVYMADEFYGDVEE